MACDKEHNLLTGSNGVEGNKEHTLLTGSRGVESANEHILLTGSRGVESANEHTFLYLPGPEVWKVPTSTLYFTYRVQRRGR